VLVVCDVCKSEHLTRAKSFQAFMEYRPDDWNAQITKLNSPSFPKILIALVLLVWWCPLLGLLIYLQLRSYRQYIRGKWRMLYGLMMWPTVVANFCWIAFGVYDAMHGQ